MGDWKYVTDDEWSDGDREAMASLLVPFRESGAAKALQRRLAEGRG